jgi:hypothetical protein
LTDDEQEMRRFFHERIVAAARASRERGVAYFPLAPEENAESYWGVRPAGESYVFRVGDDLTAELQMLWRDHPELHVLAEELAQISRRMADTAEESADVSSFIYAMF